MKTITAGVIGFGCRGIGLSHLFYRHRDVSIKYVCDVSRIKVDAGLKEYKRRYSMDVPFDAFTDNYEDVISDSEVDTVIVTVPDYLHAQVAVPALEHNKNVYLEKPMALSEKDCSTICAAAEKSEGILSMGYTLRRTPIYTKIREIIDSGVLGQIMHINAYEHLEKAHGASYMRRWHRKSSNAGSFLLAKCSHDIDMLMWLSGSVPVKMMSFGGLDYFKPENKPDAADFCADCPESVKRTCQFVYSGWGVIEYDDPDHPQPRQDLCAFKSDKDVVDNQVVILEMENRVRASFSLQLCHRTGNRAMHITGSNGSLEADFEKSTIQTDLLDREETFVYDTFDTSGGHSGGDPRIVADFIRTLRGKAGITANYRDGYNSTVACLKIDESLRTGTLVEAGPDIYL